MTAPPVTAWIGLAVPWRTGQLQVQVRIVDCKRSYGRVRYLITPIVGTGQQWIQDGLILPTGGN